MQAGPVAAALAPPLELDPVISTHVPARNEFAEELVRLEVDVIVAPTSIYAGAAKRATSTIPIVFASHADPIGSGHVASLARPGGNATGVTIVMSETTAKSLELLKEAVPGLARVAVLWDPATPSHRPGLEAVEAVGRALGLEVLAVAADDASEFDSAFSAIVSDRADGLVVLSTPLVTWIPSNCWARPGPELVAPAFHSVMDFAPIDPGVAKRRDGACPSALIPRARRDAPLESAGVSVMRRWAGRCAYSYAMVDSRSHGPRTPPGGSGAPTASRRRSCGASWPPATRGCRHRPRKPNEPEKPGQNNASPFVAANDRRPERIGGRGCRCPSRAVPCYAGTAEMC